LNPFFRFHDSSLLLMRKGMGKSRKCRRGSSGAYQFFCVSNG
jgi:hypothetical protein